MIKLLPFEFDKNSRKHVTRLQHVLQFLGGMSASDTPEITERQFGPKTTAAVIRIKKQLKLPDTPQLNKSTLQALNQKAIEKYFSTRTQTAGLHRKLLKISRIAKLPYDLSSDMKARRQGEQTGKALQAFQRKYGLPETGRLDRETLERIESVAACRVAPFKKLKVPPTERLMKVRNPIRLNKQSSRVADLHRALAWAGYPIDAREADARTYGRTTRRAVIAFQTAHKLPVTGNVGWKTARMLNSLIEGNSRMVSCKDKYRVRGSVRNDLWEGVRLATIQVYEKGLREDVLLGERKTLANGFYDLQYLPPVNPLTGKPKENYQLLVKLLDPQGRLVKEKTFHVTGKVLWANFTEGEAPYRGDADFQVLEKLLNHALGSKAGIAEIEESDKHRDVAYLRKETLLAGEDIMKMALSFRVAAAAGRPSLPAEVFYAFIRQNQPQNLPGDLLPDRPGEWGTWIAMLVERCVEGIACLAKDLQEDILKSALKRNYVSRRIARDLPQILAELERLKTARALGKPIFEGGSLQTLLAASSVDAKAHAAVASRVTGANGFTPECWQSLSGIPGVGGAAVKDLRTTVDLGYITSNFGPLLKYLKSTLSAGDSGPLKAAGDCARLSREDWVALIEKSGNEIPPWVKGKNAAQKRQAYAVSLKAKAEHLFPAVSLIAEVDRSSAHALGSVENILNAVAANPDYDLKSDHLHKLLTTAGSGLTAHEVAAAKALQRIHRIAPTAAAGAALLESGYYSAAQVFRQGKDVFMTAMGKKKISPREAGELFEYCAQQHAAVMAAIGEFRRDLRRINPECILPGVYTKEEIEELKKDVPDIETLFGPADVREVRHCESVLGPPAYLTD
ncbi:MAG TPA: peptidoglycan-binding protein, partial [Thermodesulfobacteriota bacterium]|nr:peptidoglycan-binding protein [Thermodesulfobacteriota bacterium]